MRVRLGEISVRFVKGNDIRWGSQINHIGYIFVELCILRVEQPGKKNKTPRKEKGELDSDHRTCQTQK